MNINLTPLLVLLSEMPFFHFTYVAVEVYCVTVMKTPNPTSTYYVIEGVLSSSEVA